MPEESGVFLADTPAGSGAAASSVSANLPAREVAAQHNRFGAVGANVRLTGGHVDRQRQTRPGTGEVTGRRLQPADADRR
jgi:hypothetical protein